MFVFLQNNVRKTVCVNALEVAFAYLVFPIENSANVTSNVFTQTVMLLHVMQLNVISISAIYSDFM